MNKKITLKCPAVAEIEEKKSVFSAYAAPVLCEEDAKAIIEKKKKEFSDATHNVWAYYINNGAVARYSDDGEPKGTAGMPVLNVLKMSGATDMCVVVTRYFGGTLLGTGGLVRAYSSAAKAAIDAAGIAAFEDYSILKIKVGYSDYQKLTVQLKSAGADEDSADFSENVTVIAAIESSRESEISSLVCELTNGRGTTELLRKEERPSKVI